MIQRVLEDQGLVTVSISLVREHTAKLKPPRALFVPFAFGAPFGAPGDTAQHHRVLRAALNLLTASSGPVLLDFPEEDIEGVSAAPLQASAVSAHAPGLDAASEATMMRRYYERWIEREAKTAVGLTGIPATRFRGIIRFLEAFAEGRPADMTQRPREVSLPDYLRYCVDDLKAMYLEGRVIMKPGESPDDATRWLWGDTALGGLIRGVRDRMEASDDPAMREAGFGIAR